MAGHIGHLGRDRLPPEALVELLRQAQPKREQVGVHQLAVQRAGQPVPDDIAGMNRPFEPGALLGRGLLKVLVDQPRAGRPAKAGLAACLAQLVGHRQRARDEIFEVACYHVARKIGEPDVEVRLEHQVDDLRLRLAHGRAAFLLEDEQVETQL